MADKDLLSVASQRLKRSIEARSESRKAQLADLKFLAGNSDNKYQWETADLKSRKGNGADEERPTLTINSLPHHQHQITNEQRQNRPAGKVLPVDDKADPKTAEILTDLVRHVEVSSNVAIALNNACFHQTAHGEGYYRVLAEYTDPLSFDQEPLIKPLPNPFAVYDDPDIKDPVGIDRKWAFIVDEITEEEHEAQFPGKQMVSLEEAGEGDNAVWRCEGKKIRIAEYYRVEMEKRPICLWPDGQVTVKGGPEDARYAGQVPVKEREAEVLVIKWLKTNGKQILEQETVVPGPFIPLFRVLGNEYVIDGKVEVSGIVRNAKDPCRMINFWWSQEAEWLARSPIIPFVGYEGQFAGHETKWRMANRVALPYLEAKPIVDEATNAVLPLPQRMQPPSPPVGIVEAKMQAIDALKQTTGFYDASLGARSNETSGVAIRAREKQGDIGSFHYVDNLALAVQAHTRYLVDVTPTYFDTKRVARIIGEDGTPSHATVDPEMQEAYREETNEAGAITRIFNPSVGKYDVVATTGPSYMTRRMEAAEGMRDFVQAAPQFLSVVGDLLVKNLDWPGADELAKRLKRLVPPQVLGDQAGADPAAMQQLQQQNQELTQELHQAADALQSSEQKIAIYEAETKRIQALSKYLPPDVVAQIVAGSLLTSEDLDQINDRAHPQAMADAMQPPRKPPAMPMAGTDAPEGPLQ